MSDREQDLTNALIKVTTGRQVKAYFVQGHGETDSTGNDRTGYSSVVDVLKRDNYTVDKIVLAQTPGVSRRCVGADHRGPDGGLPAARSRRDQDVPAQRRQGAVPARSAGWRIRADRADARGAAEGVGHHARTRRRASTSAAWVRCSAPTRRCRLSPAIRSTRSPKNFDLLTAFPLVAVGDAARPASSWARRTRRTSSRRASEAGRKPT